MTASWDRSARIPWRREKGPEVWLPSSGNTARSCEQARRESSRSWFFGREGDAARGTRRNLVRSRESRRQSRGEDYKLTYTHHATAGLEFQGAPLELRAFD